MFASIWNGFLDVIKTFVIWIIDILPSMAWLQIQSFDGMIELIAYTSCFMPWSTFFIALGVWIAFQNFRFVVSIVNWIIGKIPTIS